MDKKRLDILLYDMGLAPSRERAKTMIMGGVVYVDNQKSDKPGENIKLDSKIEVRGQTLKYVSRGGLKLEKSMKEYPINLSDKVCMDVGASTGGFTDCMLQNGAKKVFSVDVGYGQLAWSLRNDKRVINLERTNARKLSREQITDEVQFTSIDVSFISLKIILPAIYELLSANAQLVCLIKPQFEAGREKVGKKGVVRDKKVHLEVITNLCEFFLANGFTIKGISFSPIKGPEGNIEYLAWLEKSENPQNESDYSADYVVERSHKELITS